MFKLFKIVFYGACLALLSVLILLGISAWQVHHFAHNPPALPQRADAAVILGAAAWGDKPSPVYRERILHGVNLYQNHIVPKIIFTGGTPKSGYPTEAEVGKNFAIKQGVKKQDIILENTSRDTFHNIFNAKQIMRQHAISQILLVSDPDHMARAMSIAQHLGLNAHAAPTPTSRYTGSDQREAFFWREVAYLSLFRVYQIAGKLGIDFTPSE